MKQTFIVGVETDKKDFNEWIADHDKQIRDEVIIETLESVIKMIADWGYQDLTSVVLIENLKARIEQMKGEQNE